MKRLILGVLTAGATAWGAPWGGEEIRKAQEIAYLEFSKLEGDSAFARIHSVTSELRPVRFEEVAIKISYRVGGPKELNSRTFYCHYHDFPEIDCHASQPERR